MSIETTPRERNVPKPGVAAARRLQPVWSQVPDKVVRFEDSLERSRTRFEGLLDALGLQAPKEL